VKNLIILLLTAQCMGCVTPEAKAQTVINPEVVTLNNVKDTAIDATNTVYATITKIKSKVKAFEVTVTKISGTTAGSVVLQGRVANRWVQIDTMVLWNTATQSKVFTVSATTYSDYRAALTGSGTQRSLVSISYLRRTDE
jgi:hypothetical protein